jgi:hypothetical protein
VACRARYTRKHDHLHHMRQAVCVFADGRRALPARPHRVHGKRASPADGGEPREGAAAVVVEVLRISSSRVPPSTCRISRAPTSPPLPRREDSTGVLVLMLSSLAQALLLRDLSASARWRRVRHRDGRHAWKGRPCCWWQYSCDVTEQQQHHPHCGVLYRSGDRRWRWVV